MNAWAYCLENIQMFILMIFSYFKQCNQIQCSLYCNRLFSILTQCVWFYCIHMFPTFYKSKFQNRYFLPLISLSYIHWLEFSVDSKFYTHMKSLNFTDNFFDINWLRKSNYNFTLNTETGMKLDWKQTCFKAFPLY